ncbi:MAG: hypothetical protein AAF937_06090 [Planctomycetota bacterium]
MADSLADFTAATNDGIGLGGSPVTPGSTDDAAQHGHPDTNGTGTWEYGYGNSGDGSAFGGGFPLLPIWNGGAWIDANSPAVVGPTSQAPHGSSLNADPLTYRR